MKLKNLHIIFLFVQPPRMEVLTATRSWKASGIEQIMKKMVMRAPCGIWQELIERSWRNEKCAILQASRSKCPSRRPSSFSRSASGWLDMHNKTRVAPNSTTRGVSPQLGHASRRRGMVFASNFALLPSILPRRTPL